jgi:hypothetical protein
LEIIQREITNPLYILNSNMPPNKPKKKNYFSKSFF